MKKEKVRGMMGGKSRGEGEEVGLFVVVAVDADIVAVVGMRGWRKERT